MDLNKIIEMLEREEKTPAMPKRESVAKESLIRASGGDYDAINSLLEEDIMIDEKQMFARSHREKPVRESVVKPQLKRKIAKESAEDVATENSVDNIADLLKQAQDAVKSGDLKKAAQFARDFANITETSKDPKKAEECDSTPVGVDNPIPSPVRKKRAAEDDENCSKSRCHKSRPQTEACAVEEDGTQENATEADNRQLQKYKGFEIMRFAENDYVVLKDDEQCVNRHFDSADDAKKKIDEMSEKESCATEEVLNPTETDSVFPEEVDFDEEAFAELLGLAPEDILISYVQGEENEPEHFELRFKKEDKEVLLKLKNDGTTEEVVDARIIENPEFSYTITQDDEGNYILLVSPEEVEKDEEDSEPVKSENDTDPGDENGTDGSDEFIQENGLKLDGEYQRVRGEKAAKNASKPVKESIIKHRAEKSKK